MRVVHEGGAAAGRPGRRFAKLLEFPLQIGIAVCFQLQPGIQLPLRFTELRPGTHERVVGTEHRIILAKVVQIGRDRGTAARLISPRICLLYTSDAADE